jgi:hypothetical protein
MILGLYLWLFSAAFAEDTDYEVTVVPSDVSLFVDSNNIPVYLRDLVATYAGVHKGLIKQRLTSQVAPAVFEGKVRILNHSNMKHLDMKKCDYTKDSVGCSIKNKHWLIKSSISKERLHANFNLYLYDDQGELVASSTTPIWGFVQLLPRYKKTTITENSMFGPVKREILEQYPPKRKEIPPLINSSHVSDAIMKLFLAIEVESI